MANVELIFNIAEHTQYVTVVLLALIYSLPIMCIRRFQHRNNIFTLNVCLTTVFSCLAWLPTTISTLFGYSLDYLRQKWPWLCVLQGMSDTIIPYSLVLISFHRCCSIVYPRKRFFRTKKWMVVCFIRQWVVAALLSIPDIIHTRWVGLSM